MTIIMRYLLLISTMLIAVGLFAQRGGERGKRSEKIEEQRIAFITTELDLTVEEAQAFWPIYNDFQNEKKANSIDKEAYKDLDSMSEKEASQMLSQVMEVKRRHHELEEKFMNRLEGVIPAVKRLKLMKLEKEFKKKVLTRYQKRIKRQEKRYEKMEKKKEKEKIEKEMRG